ncbi:MAG: hypothetical protein P8M73_06180 [Luminiphilus sp.]|nr:hypothetical protein [Luminiphilus sp.]
MPRLKTLFVEGLRCVAGFFVLLMIDLFAEFYIFEWLQWNGTNKNDWFFMLWWLVVLAWIISCGVRLPRLLAATGHSPEGERPSS